MDSEESRQLIQRHLPVSCMLLLYLQHTVLTVRTSLIQARLNTPSSKISCTLQLQQDPQQFWLLLPDLERYKPMGAPHYTRPKG